MSRRLSTRAWILASILIAAGVTSVAGQTREPSPTPRPRARGIGFERPIGAAAEHATFVHSGPGYGLMLRPDLAALVLGRGSAARQLRMRLVGGSPDAEDVGIDALPAITYYANEHTFGRVPGVRTFRRARFTRVYPGIDVEYYRNEQQLEFDLIVSPYADPDAIQLSFSGVDGIERTANGLTLRVGGESVEFRRPVAYQQRGGSRVEIAAAYRVTRSTVRFELGAYDRAYPLVIDPTVIYSSYLGGSGDDTVVAADVSDAGELYLFGRTSDPLTFPHSTVVPPQQTSDAGNCFVSKMSSDGTTLVASVIFEDFACQAFDLEGDRVHVAIQSTPDDVTGVAQLRTIRFDPAGGVTISPLENVVGQILGAPTQIDDIRSDEFGATYVLYHQLVSADNTLQARLMKIDAGGMVATGDIPVRAEAARSARAIAVDDFGQVFVVGRTTSGITPTSTAFQSTRPQPFDCADDAFLLQMNTVPTPFEIVYASYLGGSSCDEALDVVRDPLGLVYVTGRTTSPDFPIAGRPLTGGPGGDGFVMKFDLSLDPASQLVSWGYLGVQLGSATQGVADVFHPMVWLPSGHLAVTGGARGPEFPLHLPLFDATTAPGFPRFVQLLSASDLSIPFSSHLDTSGAATHSVIAAPRHSDPAGGNALFAITSTPEGGLSPNRLADAPTGASDLLIRRIYYGDISDNLAPFVDLGDAVTQTAGEAGNARFDLSCAACTIVDYDGGSIQSLTWFVDGIRYTFDGAPPLVGSVDLPVGVHALELVAADTRGGVGRDTLLVTVVPAGANQPPEIVASDMTVTATSPNGVQLYVLGSVSDADNDTLDVTWTANATTVQFQVFPPYFQNNASTLVTLPIGATTATIRASDGHGHIETRDVTITIVGVNTPIGSSIQVTPADDNFPRGPGFTPGRMTLTLDRVTAAGLTYFRTRTDQAPPPPGGRQLGSAPYYYDVATTAIATGEIRVCVDTTGMSFSDGASTRLHRLQGTTWTDVTAPSTPEEAAAHLLCGVTASTAALGTFAIFTAADESTRVATIIGNGQPFAPGQPAPGDGGAPSLAPIGQPESLVFDVPRQFAYVSDTQRIRRIDLRTNTIATIAGTGTFGSIASERDGADARDVDIFASGLAVDREGNLFFAGINGCSILRVDVHTNLVRRVAGLGPAPTTFDCHYAGDGGLATQADLSGARRIAFDADGNLFFVQTVFAASGGMAIRRIASGLDHLITGDDPAETISTVAGGGTVWPPQAGDPRSALIDATDLTFSPAGDLYVGAGAFVLRITPAPGSQIIDGRSGENLTVVAGKAVLSFAPYQGDGGAALDANLNGISGIELLPNGDLLIADSFASRIRLVSAGPDHVVDGGPGETITTIAGFSANDADVNAVPFNGDGYALSTSFLGPRDVVVDPRGGVDVVDTGFNRVRHVSYAFAGGRPNQPPVARAGADQTIVGVGGPVLVQLDGRASSDPDGDPLTFRWTMGALVSSDAQPFFIVPPPGRTITLTVTDPFGLTSTDNVTITIRDGADLAVTAAATPQTVNAGSILSYAITVANNGPAGASGGAVTMPASSAFSVVSATSPGGLCVVPAPGVAAGVTCDTGPLAAGDQIVLHILVRPTVVGPLTTRFDVSSDNDPLAQNNSASLTVDVSGPLQVDAGDDQVVLATSAAGALIHLRGSGFDPDGDPVTLSWTENGASLGTGEFLDRTFSAGVHVVTLTVSDTKGEASDTVTIDVSPAGDLHLVVSGPPDPVAIDGVATWTAVVSNGGPFGAPAVRLNVILPPGIEFVGGSVSGGSCAGSGVSGTCDAGSLDVGGALTFLIRVRPTVLGLLTGALRADNPAGDPVSVDNAATVTVQSILVVDEPIVVGDTFGDPYLHLVEEIRVSDDLVDQYPPAVTPPAALTVDATETGGARSNVSPALRSFVRGATAVDESGLPVIGRLPQVDGVDVDDTTLFPVGTTTVTFRFADASGNIGAATSRVTVNAALATMANGGTVTYRAADRRGVPQNATVTFTDITQPGFVMATAITDPPPPPPGLVFATVPLDIVTTALFNGPVGVCLIGSEFTPSDTLQHFDNGQWVNITMPSGNTATQICGSTTTLSPFAVLRPANRPPTADAFAPPLVEATGPAGANVVLTGTGTDPDGDTLAFSWTEGGTTLGSTAVVSVPLALGAHEITLTVTDGHFASAWSTVRVTVRDSTPPLVTPPVDITVPATEAGGARAAAWPALAAFLAAGSAIDSADPSPVRLSPRAGGNTADAMTLFRFGTTPVTFSYRDASGNVGTATANVTVVLGTPKISVEIAASGGVSGQRRYVDLRFSNDGDGNARRVVLDAVALLPQKGHGPAHLRSRLPLQVGDLDAGSTVVVRLIIDVSPGIKKLSVNEVGTFRTVKGTVRAYLGSQTLVPDQ